MGKNNVIFRIFKICENAFRNQISNVIRDSEPLSYKRTARPTGHPHQMLSLPSCGCGSGSSRYVPSVRQKRAVLSGPSGCRRRPAAARMTVTNFVLEELMLKHFSSEKALSDVAAASTWRQTHTVQFSCAVATRFC